jgi:hypothetical protein
VRSRTVPLYGLGARFCRLVIAIPGRRSGYESVKQLPRNPCDLVNRVVEGNLICFRWSSETAQFTNKLQRRCSDFVIRGRRLKVVQRFDISTHRDPR